MSKTFQYPTTPLGWQASPHDFTGDNMLGLHTAETTQRYMFGTRKITWDGRAYRYGKCGTTFTSTTFGLKNKTVLVSSRVTGATIWAAAPQAAIAGETQVKVTFLGDKLGDSTSTSQATRTGVIAEDELSAGYIHLQTIPSSGIEHDQNRLIVGNTAVASGDTSMILYLDEPLNYAINPTGITSTCEILASPYANLYRGNNPWMSIMGMPNTTATASQLLWLQTWGPMRVSPLTDTPQEASRQYVFDDQGAVKPYSADYATDSQQMAGFLLESTIATAYWHAPFIMLQISP